MLAPNWSEAGRIYRRICVLRTQGREQEAAALQEADLASAVAALRESPGAEPETEERLQALFAAEENRVADAAVLAELLAPMLAGHWQPLGAEGASSGPRPQPLQPRPATANAPSVADFIDDMLAQERATRPRRS